MRIHNHQIEIRVKPKSNNIVDFVGKERLLDLGICISYIGCSNSSSVMLQGKEDQLKALMNKVDLDVVKGMHPVPRFKMSAPEVAL